MHPQTSQRIKQLRSWLAQQDFDALIIPHEDEFLGEYIPEHNKRLLWATGFTGSAGAAVITKDKAAIFVDGRYTVQVRKQVPAEVFEYRHLHEEPLLEWIKDTLAINAKVAIDPRMHTAQWLKSATKTVEGFVTLETVSENPIDLIWHDRPEVKVSDVRLMELALVGQSSADKRQEIAKEVTKKNADAALLTQLDSICWLLNVRGLDVSRLPVLLSHAIIHADETVDFFLDPSRLPAEFDAHVGNGVRVHNPEALQ